MCLQCQDHYRQLIFKPRGKWRASFLKSEDKVYTLKLNIDPRNLYVENNMIRAFGYEAGKSEDSQAYNIIVKRAGDGTNHEVFMTKYKPPNRKDQPLRCSNGHDLVKYTKYNKKRLLGQNFVVDFREANADKLHPFYKNTKSTKCKISKKDITFSDDNYFYTCDNLCNEDFSKEVALCKDGHIWKVAFNNNKKPEVGIKCQIEGCTNHIEKKEKEEHPWLVCSDEDCPHALCYEHMGPQFRTNIIVPYPKSNHEDEELVY